MKKETITEGKGEAKQAEKFPEKKRMQNVVRLGETNLDGSKRLEHALLGIRGISFSLANAISHLSGIGKKKVGDMSEDEIKRVEAMIIDLQRHKIPQWMLNRRKDMETGKDIHLSVSQLQLRNKLDIDAQKKIKSYRGVRHITGLPVRGQRTRSSFRKGGTVGVARKKEAPKTAKSK